MDTSDALADATVDTSEFDADTFDVDIQHADRVLPEAAPDNNTSDAAEAGNAQGGGLQPCTSLDAGTGGCVQCQGWASGVCTPTEANFVRYDIQQGIATEAGADPETGCYPCLLANSCLDDDMGDIYKECEDVMAGNASYATLANGMAPTPSQCNQVIQCILGSGVGKAQCAYNGAVSICYCGTDPAAACSSGSASQPVTMGVNGACAATISEGNGFPVGDGQDILRNFSVKTYPSGRAAAIFFCANSNGCTSCL
jgi:hypothetical protein